MGFFWAGARVFVVLAVLVVGRSVLFWVGLVISHDASQHSTLPYLGITVSVALLDLLSLF